MQKIYINEKSAENLYIKGFALAKVNRFWYNLNGIIHHFHMIYAVFPGTYTERTVKRKMATIRSTIELIDKMSNTLSTIESNINSMKSALQGVSEEQSAIDGFSWNTFLSNAEAAGEKMVKIGSKMTAAVTTPLVLLGKKLYGNAVDYESAYVGMTKTVEGTVEQYEAFPSLQ